MDEQTPATDRPRPPTPRQMITEAFDSGNPDRLFSTLKAIDSQLTMPNSRVGEFAEGASEDLTRRTIEEFIINPRKHGVSMVVDLGDGGSKLYLSVNIQVSHLLSS